MHDLVIRGGRVVDGTGAPARTADVAIDGDQIVEVGRVTGAARHEIDADGALVAPGWVDVHTHYDGQAIWDAEMAPSSHHGVTTAVMGNCGVGFAPVQPGQEEFLVEVMEGVEDIPGTALHEGIDWRWEHFGEYLDALASRPRTIDLGTQVPHAAVRAYVLGERAHEDDLSVDEYRRIGDAVAEGVRAGALGFSTSRTILHRSKHGYVPGTYAADDELSVIADALASVGRGLFQFISDDRSELPDRELMATLTARGVDVTYSLAQSPAAPTAYLDSLDDAQRITDLGGARIAPQVPARPTGMLFGLRSSFHPFKAHPSFRALEGLPLDELVRQLRTPEVRDALLAEEPRTHQPTTAYLATAWHQMYRLGAQPDYEPTEESSARATAGREGRAPAAVVLDWLLEDDGRAFLFSPLGSYVDHDHEAIRAMLLHPASIAGLSDGGAHCGLICDASFPTYLLTHWTRDRTRGERLPVEHVVHKQTQATASAYGLVDRGVLAPGLLADVNVIDLDNLTLHGPRMVHDLPAGGKRLLQDVDGYAVTVKAGEITFRDGQVTDARPAAPLRATDAGLTRT
jgi:N-acyl-D-aspartate/D-glutamate deacylase